MFTKYFSGLIVIVLSFLIIKELDREKLEKELEEQQKINVREKKDIDKYK